MTEAVKEFNRLAQAENDRIAKGIGDAWAKRYQHLTWHHDHPGQDCENLECSEGVEPVEVLL